MAFSYQVIDNGDGTFSVQILDENNNVVQIQPFDPETGSIFTDQLSAETWAQNYINSLNYVEPQDDEIRMRVQFIDPNTGAPISVVKAGTPIKVYVDLYSGTTIDETTGQETLINIPLDGQYVVPYYYSDSDIPAGSVLVTLTSGHGEADLTFTKSGIFEIKLDKVLNAETMKQPYPLPVMDSNPKLAVVE